MSKPAPSVTAKPVAAPVTSTGSTSGAKQVAASAAPAKQSIAAPVPSTTAAPVKSTSAGPAKPATAATVPSKPAAMSAAMPTTTAAKPAAPPTKPAAAPTTKPVAATGGAGAPPAKAPAAAALPPPRPPARAHADSSGSSTEEDESEDEAEARRRELDDEYDDAERLFRTGDTCDMAGRRESAGLVAMERVRMARHRLLGADHEDTLQARMAIGRMLLQLRRHDKAAEWLQRCVVDCERALGRVCGVTMHAKIALMQTWAAQGKVADARNMARQVVEASAKLSGADSAETQNAQRTLAELDAEARKRGL